VAAIDSAGIEQASAHRADLYVALTRIRRRLGLLITGEVPHRLPAAGLDRAIYLSSTGTAGSQ
jgi:hypothetical protein